MVQTKLCFTFKVCYPESLLEKLQLVLMFDAVVFMCTRLE